MITSNNLFEYFDKEITRELSERNIANEQISRPYVIGIMPDREEDADFILLENMSSFQGEVMPVVNRGKAPAQDTLPKVSMSEVQLMNWWLELPLSEQTIINTMRQVNRMKGAGKSEAEIITFINGVFGLNHSMRIQRWQDLLALEVGQSLSNFDNDGNDLGFSTNNIFKSDYFNYRIDGLDDIIDGSEMNPNNSIRPAIHPVEYLLNKLASKTKDDANEFWLGDNWARWFMEWPGWTQNYNFKIPERYNYTPAGTSTEVEAKGVRLIHESNGFKFMHITKEAIVSDDEGMLSKKKIFNPDSVICLNTEKLGSVVYAPMYLEKDNPLIDMISDNSKVNYYQDFTPDEKHIKWAGKGRRFMSGGKCLGAITGIDSIQRMTMKLPTP
jgi:hypothetical protein